jgi:hypothetical protein
VFDLFLCSSFFNFPPTYSYSGSSEIRSWTGVSAWRISTLNAPKSINQIVIFSLLQIVDKLVSIVLLIVISDGLLCFLNSLHFLLLFPLLRKENLVHSRMLTGSCLIRLANYLLFLVRHLSVVLLKAVAFYLEV